MNNQKAALTIIIICLLCLVVGIFSNVSLNKNKVEDKGSRSTSKSSVLIPTGDKIALITLDGAISSDYKESGYFSEGGYTAEGVRKSLKKALKDDSVKGVLLRINSPGGTVAMSQELYGLVLKVRAKKPVVVSMGDVAASGGYYIASAADRIYAYPGTLTGSIGVIFSAYDAQELFSEKLGIKATPVKSGKFKDIGSVYRPMTKDERALLQNTINVSYSQFLSAIEKGRINRTDKYSRVKKTALKKDVLVKYADGRIFTGEEAKQLGFVDTLGGIDDAYASFKSIYGKEYPLVNYGKSSSFAEFFSSLSESKFSKPSKMEQMLPFGMSHRNQLLYMWE